ncbi:hypothetical protein IEQ34_026539 [Dendrobium chrysotoxum]|uniref:Subtilisin n=1 Tax=Dendrobium chrysotoxum TaxID=161865 RepID=A0AAV7FM78_DENCH|nr:hypothetical protein IEQ34_026539 [Dendrobium chrysotoxum]
MTNLLPQPNRNPSPTLYPNDPKRDASYKRSALDMAPSHLRMRSQLRRQRMSFPRIRSMSLGNNLEAENLIIVIKKDERRNQKLFEQLSQPSLQNLTKPLILSNDISNTIPLEIDQCHSFVRLRLDCNDIGDRVPLQIGSLIGINFLDLTNNCFAGAVLAETGNCSELQMLNISNNTIYDAFKSQAKPSKNMGFKSLIDSSGYESHIASKVVGHFVYDMNYDGRATGADSNLQGLLESGCYEADLLAAFYNAIEDGVDIISLSLGPESPDEDFFNVAISVGSFHAMISVFVKLNNMISTRNLFDEMTKKNLF